MNKVNNILVAGNFNQSLYLREIENFLISNGLFELHDLLNKYNSNNRDNTYIIETKYIDFVAATSGLINNIEGCELINYNQIIQSNHRGYLIDLNLEQYFNMNNFDIDQVNSSQLNSRRLICKEIFIEKAEEYLKAIKLLQMID